MHQAAGNWEKEEKPVDLKVTHRARNEWGVPARAVTPVSPGAITPDGCTGVLRGPRPERVGQHVHREKWMALIPVGNAQQAAHISGRQEVFSAMLSCLQPQFCHQLRLGKLGLFAKLA